MRSTNKVKVEGGMSSMTDLVFLLLIFFIIISIMSNDTTPLDLPQTDENLKPTIEHVEDPTVVITEENKYVVLPDGDMKSPMEFDDIKGLVNAAVEEHGQMKLKVAGHRKAEYEAVFKVLALCQANGWDPVLAYDK